MPSNMTTKLLESLSAQLSAKATTNHEPMLRLRDVLDVLGAATGEAEELAMTDTELGRRLYNALGGWGGKDVEEEAWVASISVNEKWGQIAAKARELLGTSKPINVEAAKAEARREALGDAIDVADEVIRLAHDEHEGYGLTPLTSLLGRLHKLRDACKPAPAEKKAVDVEELTIRLRDCIESRIRPGRTMTGPLLNEAAVKCARGAIDFLAKNGGAR